MHVAIFTTVDSLAALTDSVDCQRKKWKIRISVEEKLKVAEDTTFWEVPVVSSQSVWKRHCYVLYPEQP